MKNEFEKYNYENINVGQNDINLTAIDNEDCDLVKKNYDTKKEENYNIDEDNDIGEQDYDYVDEDDDTSVEDYDNIDEYDDINEEDYYNEDSDVIDEDNEEDTEEVAFEQETEDDIRKIVLDCYKNVDNFYGLYYEHYRSPVFQWFIRGIAICIALAVTCLLIPFTLKVDKIIWVALFLAVWTIGLLFFAFFGTKNHPIHLIYYKQYGKPVFLYWDIKCKEYYIVNYGQKKKLKYFIRANVWEKMPGEDIVPKKLYFDQIKGDLHLKKIDENKQQITCYKKEGKKTKKCGNLMIENGKPVFIECIVKRKVYARNSFRKVICDFKRRIDFVEFNTEKSIEIPKSVFKYCKKKKIDPPDESKHLHFKEW